MGDARQTYVISVGIPPFISPGCRANPVLRVVILDNKVLAIQGLHGKHWLVVEEHTDFKTAHQNLATLNINAIEQTRGKAHNARTQERELKERINSQFS